MKRKHWVCSFDGACEPRNPGGDMGMGWVINDMVYCSRIPASPDNTNNVAEYLALQNLLKAAWEEGCKSLNITGDSQLVIRQVNGQYAVKSETLRPYYDHVIWQLNRLRKRGCVVTLEWKPRTENLAADYGARQALLGRTA